MAPLSSDDEHILDIDIDQLREMMDDLHWADSKDCADKSNLSIMMKTEEGDDEDVRHPHPAVHHSAPSAASVLNPPHTHRL